MPFIPPQPTEQALPEPVILKRRWLELRDDLIVAWERYRFLSDSISNRMLNMNMNAREQRTAVRNIIQAKTIGLYLALEVKLKAVEYRQLENLSKAVFSVNSTQLDLKYLKKCYVTLNQVLKRIGLFAIEKRMYSPEQEVLDEGA